jgi:predicted dehydrogenase
MMDQVKVAVIGLGFGQFHVRTLAHVDDARLVAIADKVGNVPGGLDTYAARYGAKGYTDSTAMFEQEDLDAVVIATSPKYRAEIIEQAASRGVAMFIEKPWATNLAHARELAERCQKHNATVMVGFSFRFHPAIVKLRELMDGELGSARMLNGEYVFDFLPPADGWLWDPENGNGLFNENSCHLFDAVCYLMGRPISVMAEAVNFAGRPSEEAAAIAIKFEGGAIAGLTVGGYGANAFWDYPRIDITTENGQARLKGQHHMWESLSWALRDADIVQSMTQPPEILGTTRYTHAMTYFLNCVKNGEPPSGTIDDGVVAVAIAEAVYESARTGKKIELDL